MGPRSGHQFGWYAGIRCLVVGCLYDPIHNNCIIMNKVCFSVRLMIAVGFQLVNPNIGIKVIWSGAANFDH